MEPSEPITASRTELHLLQDQLDGVHAWQQESNAWLATDLDILDSAAREARIDARRRLDVLKRAQAALLERSEQAVRASHAVLRGSARPATAIIAHRNEWLAHKVELGLRAEGADVTASVADGAEALGIAVAEQPDLIVVEDRLPSMSGIDVARHVRRFCPRTLIAMQVEGTDPGPLLDTGVAAVFSRRVPPAVIAEQVAVVLRSRAAAGRSEPLVLT